MYFMYNIILIGCNDRAEGEWGCETHLNSVIKHFSTKQGLHNHKHKQLPST